MKNFATTAAVLSLLTVTTGSAFADPPRHDDHNAMMQHGPAMQGPAMHGPAMMGGHDMHGPNFHAHPEWRKGAKIGRNDWNRGERVDYRAHHLNAPPRGYEWRQVDGNYVLAAAATGLIAGIILANQ
jgi:Ni/Co efflux regulator RcnB